MARRCSHCSHNGHNSRTCPNRGVKLFGVRLTDGSIQKSASMGNLAHCAGSLHGGAGRGDHYDAAGDMPDHGGDGYASEDFVPGSSSSRERKKGVPWTEEEHRMFLLGLQKLGKGDWRGISRNYVMSRTPTQVASHAQKYFIRRSNASRRKRRSSLFDIAVDESGDTLMACNDLFDVKHPEAERQTNNPLPAPPVLDKESESTDSANSIDVESAPQKLDTLQYCYPVVFPGYQLLPFPVPFWPGLPGQSMEPAESETHEVLKPTAVHSKNPINVDELVGMSKLSLGECLGDANLSSPLSLKLVQGSTRHSAFRANHANMSSRVNSSSSPVHAV